MYIVIYIKCTKYVLVVRMSW